MTDQHWIVNKYQLVHRLCQTVPTPFYLVDEQSLQNNISSWLEPAKKSGQVHIHYAVKANDSKKLLQLIDRAGCHFDIVSIGELFRLQNAGISAAKVIFSGPGKTQQELSSAIGAQIKSIHIESIEELNDVLAIAQQDEYKHHRINVALRINPDIIAGGHAHIFTGGDQHKFGIAADHLNDALALIAQCDNVCLIGLSIHLGSQIDSIDPYESVLLYLCDILHSLSNITTLQYLDLGGGVGIDDFGALLISPATLMGRCLQILREKSLDLQLFYEPGRAIIANAAALVTKVIRCKTSVKHHFVICDAGMNDYIRVALYDAVPTMLNISKLQISGDDQQAAEAIDWIQTSATKNSGKIVGPVCESADTFIKMNIEAEKFHQGDILALINAGAYSQVMASQYNSRPFIANYLISTPDDNIIQIKRRGTHYDLIQYESDQPIECT